MYPADSQRPVQLGSGIYRLMHILAVFVQMAYMIIVVMRDKYGTERICRQTGCLESLPESAETDTGIYQYSPVFITEIVAVAAAAAGKESPSCSQYLLITLYASTTPSSPARDRSIHPFSLSFRYISTSPLL